MKLSLPLLMFLLLVEFLCGAASAGWKAGAAKKIITPEKLMWMSGYGARTKPAEGKLTELWAKALVLEGDNGKRVCLVSLDLVGIDRDLSKLLKDLIKEKTGLTEEQVVFCCSHTHCGPVVRGNLKALYAFGGDASQPALIDEYWGLLKTRIPAVVAEAVKDVAPAELSWGASTAEFAVNRRENKEPDVPMLRKEGKLKGPIDHSVPVLAVRRDKKLRAVAFGYACHATVLGFYQWCGDYPGFAMENLENEYPEAVALFWAGCGADQNPLPRKEVPLAQDYGKQLATSVSNALKGELKPIKGSASALYSEIDLAFAAVPTKEEVEKTAAGPDNADSRRAKVLLEKWAGNWPTDVKYPYPVQTWALGDGPRWTFLGGEVVVDYALRLKKEMGDKNHWIAGYSNDVLAYIPSERVLKEGGYEGATSMLYYGHPSPWATGLEDKIVSEAERQEKTLSPR